MCLLYMPQTSGMKFPWALAKLWSGGVPFYLGGGGGGGDMFFYKKREKHGYYMVSMFCIWYITKIMFMLKLAFHKQA